MSNILTQAAIDLAKREKASVVAGTGLIFKQLSLIAPNRSVADIVASAQGGTWGEKASSGSSIGYPVLRSTNMRGPRVDTIDPAWCDIAHDQAKKFRLETGDILVTKSSGSTDLVGKACLFIQPSGDQAFLFSNFTLRLRPRQDLVLPEYLAWFLRSPQSLEWRYAAQQNAVGLRNLQTKEFLGQLVPLPNIELQRHVVIYLNGLESSDFSDHGVVLPSLLAEQRRIVARIEALAARIAEARGLRRQAAEEAEALYGAQATELIAFLEDVPSAPIRDLAEVRGGIQKGPHRTAGDNPVRYLTVTHVHRNLISLSDPRYFEVSPEELDRWRLRAGDVLIIEGNGSADQIGRTALFHGEIDPCVHQNHVIRVRPNQKLISPEYLNVYLNSPIGQDEVQSRSRTTSGLRVLSVGRINEIQVKVPCLAEQRRIVAYLDDLQAQVDALKRLQAETAAALDALLPSILDKAFNGEL